MENTNLHKAKAAKNDEFYTQLTDVAKELMHYKKHFKDKIVFCNCDDPTWSAFWKYFHLNFAELGLKKLISTHYDREEATYKMEYTGGDDNDIEVGVKTPLEGNGDFRNVWICWMSVTLWLRIRHGRCSENMSLYLWSVRKIF